MDMVPFGLPVPDINCQLKRIANHSAFMHAIESFSNDDGNGSRNVTIKMNSRLSNVVTSIPTRFKCQIWVKFSGLNSWRPHPSLRKIHDRVFTPSIKRPIRKFHVPVVQ